MSVQETSKEAYQSILEHLGPKQQMLYDAFKEHGAHTNLEMAYQLHWPINRITPRCLELRDRGLIVEVERRPCRKSGRTAIVWSIPKATLF